MLCMLSYLVLVENNYLSVTVYPHSIFPLHLNQTGKEELANKFTNFHSDSVWVYFPDSLIS